MKYIRETTKHLDPWQFTAKFPDHFSALYFFEEARWRGNITCPHCHNDEVTLVDPIARIRWCPKCRRKFSPTVNTAFHSRKLHMHKILYIVYEMMLCRNGVSGRELARRLGIRCATIYNIQARIRTAMSNDPTTANMIEYMAAIDEALHGGKNKNRHVDKKVPQCDIFNVKRKVVGIYDIRNQTWRSDFVDSIDGETLLEVVLANVVPGAYVATDEAKAYKSIEPYYTRKAVNHSRRRYLVDNWATTNAVESLWARSKRIEYGTHHSISTVHMQEYMDEITYRLNVFNRCPSTEDGLATFIQLACLKKITLRQLLHEARQRRKKYGFVHKGSQTSPPACLHNPFGNDDATPVAQESTPTPAPS